MINPTDDLDSLSDDEDSRMLESVDRMEMMEFLRQSRCDVQAGRTKPATAALEWLAKKHNLKLDE